MRHFVEDLGELAPLVQILDLPVPQMVDYVADVLRIVEFPTAEQVVQVPKISCSPCPSPSLVPGPQSAEQLVEVPTVLSPLRIAEQIVGTPVPLGRGQGSLPGQSSPASHSSGKRISERIVEQIVDFPEQTVEQIVDGWVRPHLLVLQMRILLGFFARSGGDAGSLLPGVLPPNEVHGSSARMERHTSYTRSEPQPPQPPQTTATQASQLKRFRFTRVDTVVTQAVDDACRTRCGRHR